MKKLIYILLILTLSVSFVACGNSVEAVEDTENEVVKGSITVQAETAWIPYYEAAIERVKAKYPEADISIMEAGVFDHLGVLDSTDPSNPDVADVFALGLDNVKKYEKSAVVTAIDAKRIVDELGGYDDFDGMFANMLKVEDAYYAMPYNIETLVVFANKANAQAHGIDLEKTYAFEDLEAEDLLAVAHNAWFGLPFTNAVGIDLLAKDDQGVLHSDLTKDFNQLTDEQQAMFVSLFDYWQKHDALGTDLWDKEAAYGYLDSSIVTGGNTTFRIDGPWSTPSLVEKTDGGSDLAVLPINTITVSGNPMAHWKGGWSLAANIRIEEDKNKMLIAEELIKELLNPAYAVDLFQTTGKILPNVDASVYNASDLGDIDKAVITAVIDSYNVSADNPVIKEWDNVWGSWENAILSWSAIKPASVEEAYSEIQASFKAMMATFQ
ncbi:sugar ABC transporter substrate-binding protein [Acidaminobacter sp. JC074]|uniref:sugar ABC transporter substrate-binding protein n=1 Tax=Acidaminobacter sp. JC074 TaxID=2530199 RepID=UPI001F10CCB8|nr:hypothetical protein [Acidaminobacter sp. JC074]MCH4889545.1 sugar ABC transporter substrate-binding protein [Acidaminobacter sp. JC074]